MADEKHPGVLRLKIYRSILEIPRRDWNGLTAAETIPFLDWEWLAALEESGSAGPKTGWHPLHMTLWDKEALIAAAPFYLKTSSHGEFVYDYFWAEAAMSLNRPWYPKLVGVVPATPAEGYKFLSAADRNAEALTRTLLAAAEDICRKNAITGLHILFADPAWGRGLEGLGYTAWEHSHFLWENAGYADFEDYLAVFTKNQRKNIRKEYRRPEEQDITLRIVPGREAREDHFRRMFELFTITNDKFIPWDARYVNEDFFLRLEKTFRDGVVFVEARRRAAAPDGLIALAMLIRKGGRIWGRYWGAYEEVRDLHFAVCYYAPMDWAIAEKIRYFDPGAGSPHKIRRGFRAVANTSYHKFFDPVLESLFKTNIGAVNTCEEETIAGLNAELPFK
ncbi:MAG: GNAT family N-acetyltransferase [Treponema sp.]|jgi:predicted N-acyltransferase|nr:GNAT family N-acetyltransferase [Treponema sp.]